MTSGGVSTGFSEVGAPAHLSAVPCPAQILPHSALSAGGGVCDTCTLEVDVSFRLCSLALRDE